MIAKKERLHELTLLQFIGCLLVVFGHSYPFVTDCPRILLRIQQFVYLFYMPLFVFCSGVLLCRSDSAQRYSFGTYVLRRAKRLLLPYLVFSIIGLLPKLLLGLLLNDNLNFDAFSLFQSIFIPRQSIWGHFWFLPVIFFLGVAGYWLAWLCRGRAWLYVPLLAASGALLFLPETTGWAGLDDIRKLAFYFILGMSASELCTLPRKLARVWRVLLALTAAAGAVALFLFFPRQTAANLAAAVLMICGMLLTAQLLTGDRQYGERSIVRRAYSFFILSWPCQLVVEILLERLAHQPYYVIMPCMLLAGIVCPIVLIRLVERLERNSNRKIITTLIGG